MTEQEPDQVYEVEDSDGMVARRKKKMILDSRENVNNVETQLALGGTPDGMNVSGQTAYHQVVRQFLRNIEPLLRNSEVSGASHAYSEATLGHITVEPPVQPKESESSRPEHLGGNSPDNGKFNGSRNNSELVLHRFSDPVEPERFEITGLKEIISNDGRTARWDVIIDKKKSPKYTGGGMKEMTVRNAKQWDYTILNNSVRVADQFLEEANIGLSLSEGEPDDGFLDL
jgi:hypothetical protein